MTTPAQRRRFREGGRCVNCGRWRDREGANCLRCLRVRRGQRQARYERLKAQGRCVRCQGTPAKGYVYCDACCARAKEARETTYAS